MNRLRQIVAVLEGERPDYVSWFGDLAYWYSAPFPTGALAPIYQPGHVIGAADQVPPGSR